MAIVAVRLTRCVADFLFSPESAGPRLIPLDSAGARYFRDYCGSDRDRRRGLHVTAYLIGIWSGDLYVRFALMIVAASVFVGYFAVAIWRGRHHAVRAFLASGRGRSGSALGHAPAGPLLGRAHHRLCRRNVSCDRSSPPWRGQRSVRCPSWGPSLSWSWEFRLPTVWSASLMSRRGRGRSVPASEAPRPENRVFRRAAVSSSLVLATLLVLNLLGFDLVASAQDRLWRVARQAGLQRRRDRARRLRLLGARHRRHQPKARGGNRPSMLTVRST